MNYYNRWMPPDCRTELYHHGVKGMRWGIRRNTRPTSYARTGNGMAKKAAKQSFRKAVKAGKKIVRAMLTVGATIALYNIGVPAVLGGVKGASIYASPLGQAALANVGINSLPQAILESGRASVTAALGFTYQYPLARQAAKAATRLTYV